jgi:hypothetical protein
LTGNLSSLDQKLEILDEALSEKSRRNFKEIVYDKESDDIDLFGNQLSGQPETMKTAVKYALWWCAFSKQNLTVYQLERFLRLDKRLEGLRIDEVLSRCRMYVISKTW